MFTGIIETIGEIVDIKKEGSNITYGVQSTISNELKIDQSVAHNGVCLTVIKIDKDIHYVTAIDETLNKSNLSKLRKRFFVNLERCLLPTGRLDGHFVYGHVDDTGKCTAITEHEGSYYINIKFNQTPTHIVVEKGSISLNGISLTVFNTENPGEFTVAIIPYTWDNTMLHTLKVGDELNLEFDIIGKYIAKQIKN